MLQYPAVAREVDVCAALWGLCVPRCCVGLLELLVCCQQAALALGQQGTQQVLEEVMAGRHLEE